MEKPLFRKRGSLEAAAGVVNMKVKHMYVHTASILDQEALLSIRGALMVLCALGS